MHVSAKKTAVSGLMMALAVVLIILSGMIEVSTLFLLAAAAFFVGIIIKEYGLHYGIGFFIGCTVLGFLLAPQKLYVLTYSMMGIYILGVEWFWQFLGKHPEYKRRKQIFIIGKFVLFNGMYLPVLFLFPKLLFAGEIPNAMILAAVLAGQVALFLYDKAYEYFLIHMWSQVRERIFGKN